MEYFATKLGAGRVSAPASTLWWPRHTLAASYYLLSRCGKDEAAADQALDEMETTSDAWERDILKVKRPKKAPALMKEHAFMERAMVDAALCEDPILIGKVGDLLGENARNQCLLYGSLYESFPEGKFGQLFIQHISLFVEAVGWRLKGDLGKLLECDHRRKANAVSLAALTAEWF